MRARQAFNVCEQYRSVAFQNMFFFSIDHFFTFACLHMTWSVLSNGYMFILWPKNSLSAMKTKLLDTFPTSRADRIKLKGIAVSSEVALTSTRWLKFPSEWITKQKFDTNTPNVRSVNFPVCCSWPATFFWLHYSPVKRTTTPQSILCIHLVCTNWHSLFEYCRSIRTDVKNTYC